jgi:ATP-dependent Lon protease
MLPETLPVCPVRGSVIYPTMVMPIDAGRPISIRAIDEALARERVLLIVSQKDKEVENPKPSDLYEVGTACNILKMRKNPDGSVQVLVQAFARVRVKAWLDRGDHLEAQGEVIPDEPGDPILVKALVREVKEKFQALLKGGQVPAP